MTDCSDDDSDDDWKCKRGDNEEYEDGDEGDVDDDGPKSVNQPRTNNKLDLMEMCKYYEQKIRHLPLQLRAATSHERQMKHQIRMD
jgi:hypothetical protein